MNIDILNAYCGLGHPPRPRLSQGRFKVDRDATPSYTATEVIRALGVKVKRIVSLAVVGRQAFRRLCRFKIRPFVARRRLYLVDARTTTLLDADEQKHSRPWR